MWLYIRINIMNGMGIWIDKNHCTDNFLTFALQYPKGILKINIINVITATFIVMI